MNLLKIGKFFFIYIITFYQKFISPWLPSQCRFYPSCSNYSKAVFLKYGVIKGIFLTARRLLKCHPFHPGGHDPIP